MKQASRMRCRVLFGLLCGALLGACALDWDALETGPGNLNDASDEPGLGGDARTDAPAAHDSSPRVDADEADAADAQDEDAERADGSSWDASTPDSFVADASIPDSSLPDTSVPDSSIPDTSVPDTSVPDAGCPFTFSGTLATYDFTGELGNQVSTAAKSSASGVTAGAISRSGTIVAQLGSSSINGSNWSTSSSLDGTRYYTLTVTPASKCAMDLTSVSVDTKASGTGPSSGAVATSDDSFVAATSFATNSVTSVSISVSGSKSAVEVRVYGYNASSAAGTLRIQNTLTLKGALK